MIANQLPTVAPEYQLDTLFAIRPDFTEQDRDFIARAYTLASYAHREQTRKSGEPYVTHCIAVAQILNEMRLDAEALAAALMHDVVEDTDTTLDELRSEFGDKVTSIIESVTKLKDVTEKTQIDKRDRRSQRTYEYMKRMALAMNNDVRVVLVKLADRLHNMRTLEAMKPDRQTAIAQETLDFYAPLANRLGIWQFKWELEDLCFRFLKPDAYAQLAESVAEGREAREAYLYDLMHLLRTQLEEHNIANAHISARHKHLYSIYRKMERKKLPFDQIFDVRALRVIVETIPQCYIALGVVHNLWAPIRSEFDDYIASPKDNFYQSLHTAVYDRHGKTVEVQIRTREMHEHAEYGVAAHWRYKEGGKTQGRDDKFEQRIAYLRRLMEFEDSGDNPEEFIQSMRAEFFQDRVYAFSPKGDIYDLPAGATVIDFAYYVHSDIGNSTTGAKVNGHMKPLDYVLRTGDQVQIITGKRDGPSLDWLNPTLGYTHTERARTKIRYWFRKQNRDKAVGDGRRVLENEIKRYGMTNSVSFETVAKWFNFDRVEDFLVAVGTGDIHAAQIANRLVEAEPMPAAPKQLPKVTAPSPRPVHKTSGDFVVDGVPGLLMSRANCCKPVPGDAIVGYITRGRGVSVHRADCRNIGSEEHRLIEVSWSYAAQEQCFSIPTEVIAFDRHGLLMEITTVIANEKVNMSSVNVITRNQIAIITLTLEVSDRHKLTRILTKLSMIPGVTEAHRQGTTRASSAFGD